MNEYNSYEIKFIIDNYNDMSARDISKILNRPLSSVQCKVQELGLLKESCPMAKWNDDEIEYLKNNYNTKSNKELSIILNRSESSVRVKISKLGLKRESQFYFDKNKFENILTEEDAYWLGFLYADGYVCISNRSRWLGIELQYRDKKHLSKLNKFMDGNIEVKTFNKKSPSSENICKMCSISFSSKNLVENLINKGCVQRKSKIIRFPFDKMKTSLYKHFIRGYFDGDGSLGKYFISKKYRVRASITCGSIDFLNDIQHILNNENIYCGISSDRGSYKMFFSGEENIKNFLDYIYKDAIVYLDRKYEKYISIYNA